jgi:NAD(P)-dependent dehydrogenase (short-subunit alcohol dehydrogenase family)
VINTTSTARFFAGAYDLSNPHLRGEYKPWVAYGYSKRANLHFAIELNDRLAAAGAAVTALSADPGFSHTDLQAASARSSGGSGQRLTHRLVRLVGQSAARGALPQLRAGTDPKAEGGSLY